jgi:hypothetical protein
MRIEERLKPYGHTPKRVGRQSDICDVEWCEFTVAWVMSWPDDEKRPLRLCRDDATYYMTIAGPHMTFELVKP